MRAIVLFASVVLLTSCRAVLGGNPRPVVPPGLWIIRPDTGCTILTNYRGDTLRFVLLATTDISLDAPNRRDRWFSFPRDSIYYRGPGSTFVDSLGVRREVPLPIRDVLAVDDPQTLSDDPNRKIYRLNMRNPCLVTNDLSILDRFSQLPR